MHFTRNHVKGWVCLVFGSGLLLLLRLVGVLLLSLLLFELWVCMVLYDIDPCKVLCSGRTCGCLNHMWSSWQLGLCPEDFYSAFDVRVKGSTLYNSNPYVTVMWCYRCGYWLGLMPRTILGRSLPTCRDMMCSSVYKFAVIPITIQYILKVYTVSCTLYAGQFMLHVFL